MIFLLFFNSFLIAFVHIFLFRILFHFILSWSQWWWWCWLVCIFLYNWWLHLISYGNVYAIGEIIMQNINEMFIWLGNGCWYAHETGRREEGRKLVVKIFQFNWSWMPYLVDILSRRIFFFSFNWKGYSIITVGYWSRYGCAFLQNFK